MSDVPLSAHQIENSENLKKRIIENNVIVIDVRGKDEIEKNGKIENSKWINIEVANIEAELSLDPQEFKAKYGLDKPKTPGNEIVFHCFMGRRGGRAVIAANKLGYTESKNLEGGMRDYGK